MSRGAPQSAAARMQHQLTMESRRVEEVSVEELEAIEKVQIEGHIYLRIVKACKDAEPEAVFGRLFGWSRGKVLEVSNCFPEPSKKLMEEAEYGMTEVKYYEKRVQQLQMCQYDSSNVGFFKTDSFSSIDFVNDLLPWQKKNKNSVCIIFDRLLFAQGLPSLKAFRLTERFMRIWNAKEDVPTEKEQDVFRGLIMRDAIEELPIMIHNTARVGAFLSVLAHDEESEEMFEAEELDILPDVYIKEAVPQLINAVDEYSKALNPPEWRKKAMGERAGPDRSQSIRHAFRIDECARNLSAVSLAAVAKAYTCTGDK
eukprot:TRINITY_DN1889_c0_g1_i1.p1 TRINITY_DN1889_c0_g1~~TRINITY_DN1889_c0_g1_i1.p1  ORF type:complete len:313 (+),score=98.08 TRINITY_DN1889_c0_g1_i1:144-1082(+)